MLKLYSIISGSSGNCTLITNGKNNILIDCGASVKRATEALESLNVPPTRLNAILVSHEHIDHTRGVGILAKKHNIPVYATFGTHKRMALDKIDENLIREITPDVTFDIAGFGVTPFAIPHDALDPCGFVVSDGVTKVATATDIGIMRGDIISRLYGCESVLLESNHDIDMLQLGDYPYALKRRILSDVGHLSNRMAAQTAVHLIKNGTKHIMLGHLSDKNNLPEIAKMETFNALTDNGIKVGEDMTLQVAERYKITEME